jgi:poly(beta-D-mannuronate) lyase
MTARHLAMAMTLFAAPLAAQEVPECPAAAEPVVALGFGSRYTDDSKNRSDFDEESDKAVTAALKPIDEFIADLARQTDVVNNPDSGEEARLAAATCVMDLILPWAEADALSDLSTQGASLSAPSRVGGIAFAYAAARTRLPDAGSPVIDAWLLARARQTMTFFDTEAPTRAARNNLRAWAGVAVARIGLTLDDPVLIGWGAVSATLVVCTAAPDGSLPQEMWRGRLALHYQLHAVAPLVLTAALLEERRPGLFAICDNAIPRVVGFTVAALADPALVEEITGDKQTVGGPDDPPRDFELAWGPAYLRFMPDPKVEALIKDVEKLGNSKLGGDQRLLWPVSSLETAPTEG